MTTLPPITEEPEESFCTVCGEKKTGVLIVPLARKYTDVWLELIDELYICRDCSLDIAQAEV